MCTFFSLKTLLVFVSLFLVIYSLVDIIYSDYLFVCFENDLFSFISVHLSWGVERVNLSNWGKFNK